MNLSNAFVGAKCFDTVAKITPGLAAAAKSQGYACAIRYVGMLTDDEIQVILNAGLALMAVTTCRAPGWRPSKEMGVTDGFGHAATLTRLGLSGATNWLDIEGIAPDVDSADIAAYVNAWSAEFRDPGLYVGAGSQLTSGELYALSSKHYWKGLSRIVDRAGVSCEPACGYGMVQLYPSQSIAGMPVDISFVQQDYIGRLPTWAVA